MSSAEDDSDSGPSQPRRKSRRTRACDMCRRRKVRCDGSKTTTGICTNCVTFKYKCTYVQSAAKRTPDAGYVEALEAQVSEMRALLARYRQLYPDGEPSGLLNRTAGPGTTFSSTVVAESSPSPVVDKDSEQSGASRSLKSTPSLEPLFPSSPARTPVLEEDQPEFEPSDDEVSTRESLAGPFNKLTLYPGKDNFQGKSSTMMFLRAALDSRKEYVDGDDYSTARRNDTSMIVDRPGGPPDVSSQSEIEGKGKQRERNTQGEEPVLLPTRLEYWNAPNWILRTLDEPHVYEFPPPDLLQDLLTLYFTRRNAFTPILHQPTFEAQIRSGLHLRDNRFGAMLLMVCAVASTASNDPRVLLDEEREENAKIGAGAEPPHEREKTTHSAGWKWFEQVRRTRLAITYRSAALYDIQLAYFVAVYSWESAMSWHGVGYGLRVAQVLGLHRKKSYGTKPTVEGELGKRVFWALIHHDRAHSAIFGRPFTIQDEDFDADLPIACDDEYWLHPDPDKAFKQPEGKPSKVTFFNLQLRLSQIHAYALRTIYSINKSKTLLGLVGRDWQQKVVAQIDSALNRWLDSLPAHLRWDPQRDHELFFHQSAILYAEYYLLQIMVHRPFISKAREPSPLAPPSLTICTNAARACVNVMEVQFKRTGEVMGQYALFSAAIILLLNIWRGRKPGMSPESMNDLQKVHRIMHMVKCQQPRSHGSGKIWDAISNLLAVGELPFPEQSSSSSKRPRKDATHLATDHPQQPHSPPGERSVAGSRRVQQFQQRKQADTDPPAARAPSPSGTDSLPDGVPSEPLVERQHMQLHPSWGDMSAPSMIPSTRPPTMADSPDAMAHPSIDPVVEALLSILSPAQYQQPYMVSGDGAGMAMAHGDPSRDAFEQGGAGMWGDTMFGTGQSVEQGMFTSMLGGDGGQQSALPITGEGPEFDPSMTWSSAPSGFAWEDWEAYLTNFSGFDEGPASASGGAYSQ